METERRHCRERQRGRRGKGQGSPRRFIGGQWRRSRRAAAPARGADRRHQREACPHSEKHRRNAILSADAQAAHLSDWCVMTDRDTWDPTQYERFRQEREQPFHDLAALITRRPAARMVDLGCGTGLLTAALHRELAGTTTIGIDSSDAMLERARSLEVPGLTFVRGDIGEWEPEEPLDIVFSNAALHWLPDHPRLVARLTRMLVPGGELAVQVPANFDHVSHVLAAQVAREEPFATAMHGYTRTYSVLTPEAYATLLYELGYAAQSVRLQVYGHVLESTDSVVEWVRGTLLTDYVARMPESLHEEFVARYRERLNAALGEQRPYFYPFKRILLWGRLAGA